MQPTAKSGKSILSNLNFSLKNSASSTKLTLFLALLLNCICVIPFVLALTHPLDNIDFIYKGALGIFIFQFLSMHSSILVRVISHSKMVLGVVTVVIFYLLFGAVFAFTIGVSNALIVFALSLGKYVWQGLTSSSAVNSISILRVLIFLTATFLALILSGIIVLIFPFPEVVYQMNPDKQSSGVFVETPQVLLVWGMLYFALDTIADIAQANSRSPH